MPGQIPETVRLLPLAGRAGRNRFALVDEDVYAWATGFNWFINDRGYIHRNCVFWCDQHPNMIYPAPHSDGYPAMPCLVTS